ncbi:MAG TPA: hypothetical protein PLY86_21225 [bacterium]|nr:hypothetical protein [bacterium]
MKTDSITVEIHAHAANAEAAAVILKQMEAQIEEMLNEYKDGLPGFDFDDMADFADMGDFADFIPE